MRHVVIRCDKVQVESSLTRAAKEVCDALGFGFDSTSGFATANDVVIAVTAWAPEGSGQAMCGLRGYELTCGSRSERVEFTPVSSRLFRQAFARMILAN